MNQDVKAPFDQEVIFHHLDDRNTPAAKQIFKLTRDGEPAPPPDDQAKKGGATTSTDGATRLQRSDGPEIYRVRWLGRKGGSK
jgi:type VI secretion system secreted protein VgrG